MKRIGGLVGSILLIILVVLWLAPALLRAIERNRFALAIQPQLVGLDWLEEAQVCASHVPPPELELPACTDYSSCYLNALFALRQGAWDNAKSDLESADESLALWVRGWSEWCSGSPSLAMAVWKQNAIALGGKFYRSGQLAIETRDWSRALRVLTSANELVPGRDTSFLLGRAYDGSGDLPHALRWYRASLEGNDAPPGMYWQTAELEYRLKDLTPAREHAEIAVRGSPLQFQYWQTYGNILYSLGDWAEAEAAYSRVIALEPMYPHAYAGLGFVLVSQQRLADARAPILRAVELLDDQKQQAGYLAAYAAALTSAGDRPAAAELYAQAVKFHPENEGLWGALMNTYVSMGECERAADAFAQHAAVLAGQNKSPGSPPVCPKTK